MSEAWKPLRRAVTVTALFAIVDVGGARVIDGLNVADRLLSGGMGAIGWLPVIAVFFVARLMLYSGAPGLVIRGVLLGVMARRLARR